MQNQSGTRRFYVYILASRKNGTLYVGMTNNIINRVGQHKEGQIEGFTKMYHVHNLVYFEQGLDVESTIKREKQLKHWNRAWKIRLIEQFNPEWKDLYPELISDDGK